MTARPKLSTCGIFNPVLRRALGSLGNGLGLWLVLVVLLGGSAAAQPTFPALSGRIVDEMGLLTSADHAELLETLKQLEVKSSDQIVIYVAKSLQGYPIEDFGYQLGRAWKIGQAGINNGIVLIVAPNDKKVRIEVGRGLEPQMTDVMSSLIVQTALLPAFRRGDFPGGIKAAVRDIKDVLLGDAAEVEARAKRFQKRGSSSGDGLTAVLFLAFWIFIAVMIVLAIRRQNMAGRPDGRTMSANERMQQRRQRLDPQGRQQNSGPMIIVIPGGWGGSSSWPGSSGSSDGGFSGGGGDFGGGGASGSWD